MPQELQALQVFHTPPVLYILITLLSIMDLLSSLVVWLFTSASVALLTNLLTSGGTLRVSGSSKIILKPSVFANTALNQAQPQKMRHDLITTGGAGRRIASALALASKS
jgi:hypothetical protein